MANNTLIHKFVSTQLDGSDTGLVRPISNWDAELKFSGGAAGQILVRDSTQTDGLNWSGAKAPNLPANATIASGATIPAPVMAGILTGSTFRVGDVSSAPATFVGMLTTITTDAATTLLTKQTLASYSLPANSLAVGKAVRIRALFTTAANVNSKTAYIDFGATTVNSVGTSVSSDLLELEALVIATGAATQISGGVKWRTSGAATLALVATPAETLSGAIVIAAAALTPTAAGDCTFRGMIIEMLN